MTPSAGTHGSAAGRTRRQRMPPWLRRLPGAPAGRKAAVERLLASGGLHTVCIEARCPNRSECFGRGTATFLILGDRCTRQCRFCAVSQGPQAAPDPDEPSRVADAVVELGLDYVVVTSVTRDDLADGGAGHFAATVRTIARRQPAARVELLVPDFDGSIESVATVLESGPTVLNHNVETVPRLYPEVRPQASFERSLALLTAAAEWPGQVIVKSGFMVGLGEEPGEVAELLGALAEAGCNIVTIGQYLQPSEDQAPVAEYVEPGRFEWYAEEGRKAGIARVVAGPYVRSSYRARESALAVLAQRSHRLVEGGRQDTWT